MNQQEKPKVHFLEKYYHWCMRRKKNPVLLYVGGFFFMLFFTVTAVEHGMSPEMNTVILMGIILFFYALFLLAQEYVLRNKDILKNLLWLVIFAGIAIVGVILLPLPREVTITATFFAMGIRTYLKYKTDYVKLKSQILMLVSFYFVAMLLIGFRT